MNEGIKAAAVLTLPTLLFALSIQTVSSIGVHYELDKPYYHPGDTGKLLPTGDEDVMIFGVEMNIHSIGIFKFNMTGIPELIQGPPYPMGGCYNHLRSLNSLLFGELDASWTLKALSSDF